MEQMDSRSHSLESTVADMVRAIDGVHSVSVRRKVIVFVETVMERDDRERRFEVYALEQRLMEAFRDDPFEFEFSVATRKSTEPTDAVR